MLRSLARGAFCIDLIYTYTTFNAHGRARREGKYLSNLCLSLVQKGKGRLPLLVCHTSIALDPATMQVHGYQI